MVLSVIANFEVMGLLKPDSEVKDLGVVMAMYMQGTKCWEDLSLLDEEDPETEFSTDAFSDYLFSYANKYQIKLQGPPNIDEIVKDLQDVDLPDARTKDPWNWADAFKQYLEGYGRVVKGNKREIGGDELDITAWTSKDRKSKSFSGKDPLGKNEIKALKEGAVLQLA